MRKVILCLLGVAMLALFAGTVAAETTTPPLPLQISGEIRVRNENDNRDFNSDTGFNNFSLMRTRLGVSVKPAQDMNVFVQMQDSRLQGVDTPSTVPGDQQDRLDLHQGYFEVSNLGWPGVGIKAGRMEVRFGNERLIGVNDWDNVSTTFDGVMATYGGSRLQVQTLFANLNEMDSPVVGTAPANQDRTLQAAYSTIGLHPNASADLYVINKRDNQTSSKDDGVDVVTLGTRMHGTVTQMLDYSAEAAYQTGTDRTVPAAKMDIAAYMFAGAVGRTFGSDDRPVHVGAGFDYLSGDDTSDNKLKSFDTLFGDNHRFYGLMDIPIVLSRAGLQDVQVNLTGTVFKSDNHVVGVGAEVHNFRLAAAGTGSNALGNEVDVHARWTYRQRFVPTLGASVFMPGDAVPGPTPGVKADNSLWFYAQGTVAF